MEDVLEGELEDESASESRSALERQHWRRSGLPMSRVPGPGCGLIRQCHRRPAFHLVARRRGASGRGGDMHPPLPVIAGQAVSAYFRL